MTPSLRLKQAIESSGFTYRELEEKTKISRSAIQRYASGATAKIPMDAISLLSEQIGVSPAYIMGWSDTDGNTHTPKPGPDPNWRPTLTTKDEQNIQEKLEDIRLGISDGANAANDGLGLHEYSAETQKAVMNAIEIALHAMTLERKERFTPNKHKQVKGDQ